MTHEQQLRKAAEQTLERHCKITLPFETRDIGLTKQQKTVVIAAMLEFLASQSHPVEMFYLQNEEGNYFCEEKGAIHFWSHDFKDALLFKAKEEAEKIAMRRDDCKIISFLSGRPLQSRPLTEAEEYNFFSSDDFQEIISEIEDLKNKYPGAQTKIEIAQNEVLDKVIKILEAWNHPKD